MLVMDATGNQIGKIALAMRDLGACGHCGRRSGLMYAFYPTDGGHPAHPCCQECLHEGGPFQGILSLMGDGEVDAIPQVDAV